MLLHQEDVHAEQRERGRGENGHVHRVEPCQRCAGHVLTATRNSKQEPADHGDRPDDLRAHARREVRELVPREEIPREPERERQAQQQETRDPRQLPRGSVRPHEEHAEQVHEDGEDEEIGRPRVNRANQPAELDLRHEELHRLERALRARSIVDEQQRPGGELHHKEEERHAAEVVPDRVPVHRHVLLGGELSDGGEAQSRIEPTPHGSASARFLRCRRRHPALLTMI